LNKSLSSDVSCEREQIHYLWIPLPNLWQPFATLENPADHGTAQTLFADGSVLVQHQSVILAYYE
jgi:hypothetical protein